MKITICGGGWLGQPLAQQLIAQGHQIIATSRTRQGVVGIANNGIPARVYTLGDPVPEELKCDLLILNIPPGRGEMHRSPHIAQSFVTGVTELIRQLCGQTHSKLIFISTSAVYGNAQGYLREDSPVAPQTPSAKAHVQIEQFIGQQIQQNACILRLAGLIGQQRHPIRYLAGKKHLPNGSHPVNLVHQADVIRAISLIITRQVWGQVLHLSATEHPSRQAYYNWAAKTLALIPPDFCHENNKSKGKIIDPSGTLEKLAMELAYPSPYDML